MRLLEAAPTDNQGPSQLCGLSAITENASSPRSFHSNIFFTTGRGVTIASRRIPFHTDFRYCMRLPQ
jgi:hypothetical protein